RGSCFCAALFLGGGGRRSPLPPHSFPRTPEEACPARGGLAERLWLCRRFMSRVCLPDQARRPNQPRAAFPDLRAKPADSSWRAVPGILLLVRGSPSSQRLWPAQRHLPGSPRALSLASPPPPLRGRGDSVCDFPSRDSFWIIEGLLLSGMAATAEGMIQNFLFLVEKFGHIPNGGRVYYERRSQPPFLTLMMESYLKHTNSTSFLRRNIHLLEAEYRFWQQQRAVNISTGGQQYQLNRYRVPESGEQGVLQACSLWAELKTAAESGWDFSSRWFLPGPRSTQATLRDTKASEVVPVDLNAILCRVERLLATFYRELGNSQKADSFQAAHEQRVAAIRAVLWDDQAGSWFDYDLLQQRKSTAFYPSNVAPLWAECGVDAAVVEKALGYLQGSSALSYANGLPASLARTGQQWDLPNAWAPLQHMVIEGLAKSSLPQAQELAFTLAQRWVRMNLAVYERHHAMFEKYVVEGDGEPGTGGEYPVQVGFGWTNGVVLQLLDRYGSRLTSTGALVTPMLPWIGTCLALALL
uniref:Trehalase n=1 Tax=Varanus komodoensis TaxID=61221 RepID=A0A8D2JL19_VARKO